MPDNPYRVVVDLTDDTFGFKSHAHVAETVKRVILRDLGDHSGIEAVRIEKIEENQP